MDYSPVNPISPPSRISISPVRRGAIGFGASRGRVACRFGQDGPAIMLPQVASQGDGVRGGCRLRRHRRRETRDPGSELPRPVPGLVLHRGCRRAPSARLRSDCLFMPCRYRRRLCERTGDPDGLRAYCDPIGVGWNLRPDPLLPGSESVEQGSSGSCARRGRLPPPVRRRA